MKYFFGLPIKSFIDLKIFGATLGIGGGNCPRQLRTPRIDSFKLVNYTIIEKSHKVRKKIFVFLLCGCYM